ncbi:MULTISPECIES: leucine efflux protein LeuE [Gulbenkiania]|uniref:Threonine/homoserine/homoserine lactone efflux protein n=2 Tax=Gulbenkiania TaxID=397456 RepID=A0A0K6GT42_9NEIS|nr:MULTISPECIES: leucine efflux protein LeuE [Gulbenkiania]TCW32410.1 leucine efflux protein [Gulbenkiania mobilis]CUA81671.1 Threonine/homoserine/homoserine lactone efflux protein [Gulbenkiania indica]
MLGITDLTTYLVGTIIIVLLPGPNSLYVLSVAAQRGVRAGFAGACGIFLGDAILMFLAATGAAGILKANPALFAVIKYLGGGYLAWLGIQMLRGALRGWFRPSSMPAVPNRVDASRPFVKALAISLMNPKAILFFVSFFVQFVDPAYPYPALTFVALGVIVQCCSALYLTTVILAGSRLAEAFRRRRRLSAAVSGGVGALFLGFGAKLAAASL